MFTTENFKRNKQICMLKHDNEIRPKNEIFWPARTQNMLDDTVSK